MNYFFIPTTSLNFNNILSTGSISPANTYSSRGFGYKQFEYVEPNPFGNILVLYNQYPVFTINDIERDNDPMIIRINADLLPADLVHKADENGGVDIYTYNNTIYLNPSSTVLYFQNIQALQKTINKSGPSLTTKLVKLFSQNFKIQAESGEDSFKWSKKILKNVKDEGFTKTVKYQELDDRINRLKGFIYGFILGSYKSISSEIAACKSKLRDLKNEGSALLSDPSNDYPQAIRKDIEQSFITLEEFFGEVKIGKKRFDLKNGDDIRIDNNLDRILEVIYGNERDRVYMQFIIRLVNEYCLSSKFFGQLDEKRLDVALECGQVIRNIVEDKWDGSAQQKYVNALLNNIKSGDKFDLNESDSIALQSFAAFLLKGDDLEKLESFLTTHGIGDFRFAFALWGAMFGFSKIPKTIFDLAFTLGDKTYAVEIFQYVYGKIHGRTGSEIQRPPTSLPEPPSKNSDRALFHQLIGRLKYELPNCQPWLPKIEGMLTEFGFNKSFIIRLNRTKIKALSTNTQKGISKKEVIAFFNRELDSQIQNVGSQFEIVPLEFWNDENAWRIICKTVPIRNQEVIKKDLKWFQREWQNPDSKYYGWRNPEAKAEISKTPIHERTNYDAIEAFYRLIKNKGLNSYELDTIQDLLRVKYQ